MRSEWKRLLKTPENKNFMQIPLWLISKASQVSGNALWLLCYLSNHDDGWDPGIQQISDETGWDPQKIKRYFKELVKAKFLCRTPGGKAGKLKTFRSNIHDWVFLSTHVYGPFPTCSHCGHFPSHLSGIKSDTSILTGIKSDTSKLSGGIKSDTSGGIKSDTTNYKKTRKGFTRKEVAREALPPSTSQTDNELQLDAQTPKDLEEKPAKKKVKSKAREKPKFCPLVDGNDFSGMLAQLEELKSNGMDFAPQNAISNFVRWKNKFSYTMAEMACIIDVYCDAWAVKDVRKAKVKQPSLSQLQRYMKYGRIWNDTKTALDQLKFSNNQTNGLHGDELFPVLLQDENNVSTPPTIE